MSKPRGPARSHDTTNLTDEQLRCRRFGHDFSPYHSIDIERRRGVIVGFTELLHCRNGCGVKASEHYESYHGRIYRVGKRSLDYSSAPGYLVSKDFAKDDYRNEWFSRFPPVKSIDTKRKAVG